MIILAAGVGLWAIWQFLRERRIEIGVIRHAASWLLIASVCAVYILWLVASMASGILQRWGDFGELLVATGIWAGIVGVWALQQCIRGLRTSDVAIHALDGSESGQLRSSPPAWWLPGVIATVYALSFLPAIEQNNRVYNGRLCFETAFRRLSLEEPLWVANPLLWLGCIALFYRKPLWAGLCGLGALGLALTALRTNEPYERFLGAWLWLASIVLLAGGGFSSWRRPFSQDRPRDAKVVQPEIGVPNSRLDRDFDGP
jgi:hypothetical protein